MLIVAANNAAIQQCVLLEGMNDKMGDQMDYLMTEISRLRKNRGINHSRISMMKNINVDISRGSTNSSSIVESLSDDDDDDTSENDNEDYDSHDDTTCRSTASNDNDEEDTSSTKKDMQQTRPSGGTPFYQGKSMKKLQLINSMKQLQLILLLL
jgi:hypothetical protein